MSFDREKANFILISCVVGWLLFMSSLYVGSCTVFSLSCPQDGRIVDFINGLLASVFAYVAGSITKRSEGGE